MKAKKILYISQEIAPYVEDGEVAILGHDLPQSIQDNGHEIRNFLPKWGTINERRNQLHEVIRLSGMNIIIDETDHPLIIKVASISVARMQVYFIDNEDYFFHRRMACDKEGKEYIDNAERAIFYARGVLETVKKLRWVPDVIHCNGWVSAIAPFFIRNVYQDEPCFRDAKIVYSLYDDMLQTALPENFKQCLKFRTADSALIDKIPLEFKTAEDLYKLGIYYSDGVIKAQPNVNGNLIDYALSRELPIMEYPGSENYTQTYSDFYDLVKGGEEEEEDSDF